MRKTIQAIFITIVLILLASNSFGNMEFRVRIYNPYDHLVGFKIKARWCDYGTVPNDGVSYAYCHLAKDDGSASNEWWGFDTDSYWKKGEIKEFTAASNSVTSFTVVENHGAFQNATILEVYSTLNSHVFYIVNSDNHSYVQTLAGVKIISECEKKFGDACHYALRKSHDYTIKLVA